MSTTDHLTPTQKLTPFAGYPLVLAMFAAIYPRDHIVAWGALAGGTVVAVLIGIAMLRRNRAEDLWSRGVTGMSDEREKRISLQAWAVTGIVSFLLVTLAMIAVLWGADPLITLAVMTYLLGGTCVVAHVVIARRS